MTIRPPRVLMLSDVYFPRVNGVSTSIQTFRRDLDAAGCHSILVAPRYPQARDDEPGVVRVRSRYLPFDPEDRLPVGGELERAALERRGECSVIGKTFAESRIPVIQRVQFSKLRLGELEIEDVQVFAPVIGPARLRQRHRADLEVPAQQDLRG